MATLTTPPHSPVFNLPNQLTFLRLGLAVVLFGLIAAECWVWCFVVFALAALTDWLDGYFARKQGISSALGRNLDPLVDKVLICGAYIFLVPVPHAGLAAWMATLVVARELIITSLRGYLESQGAKFGADWLGKLKMGLQCAALLGAFLYLDIRSGDAAAMHWTRWLAPESLFDLLRAGLIYAMLLATALSGLQYLWRAALLLKTTS